jgi:3-(3-hydroxy-phenyl)propionate hydroxylase
VQDGGAETGPETRRDAGLAAGPDTVSAAEPQARPAAGIDTEVVVVGLGPVGAVLATLLGRLGRQVVVVERDVEPYPLPRAVAADDEVLRVLTGLPGQEGLLDDVNGVQRAAFVDGERRVLAEMAFGETPLGMPGLAFFSQPRLERALRRTLAELPTVTLLAGRTVTDLRPTPTGVTVELAGGDEVTGRYVVGCDGAASRVREVLGIPYVGRTASAPWLVVDVAVNEPLRSLPYFSYVCDPHRPSVSMPLPGGHRWEWMVLPGEDPEQLATPESVRGLLAADVDPDSVRVIRRAVYVFHARMADVWRQGRVLLAGDAAHSMPPFAGQGFGAGVRDAANLAWRLDEVLTGRAAEALLDGYERERRPHVRAMTRLALLAGRVLQSTSSSGAIAARGLLLALDGIPGLRSAFRAGRARPAPHIPRAGLPPNARISGAGTVLPNVRVRTLDGHIRRLDNLLGEGWGLLARGRDPALPPGWPASRPVVTLAVVEPGGLRGTAGLASQSIEDLDGGLLELVGRSGERTCLVRPDRFLVGVDTTARLAEALEALQLQAQSR